MKSKAKFLKNALSWLLLFTVLVVAPLFLAIIGHQEESRGFWIEFGVGLGFVGLAMMGLQFVLTARYSKIGAPFGLDELLQFHGQAGYIAWLFIMGHFIVLFLANSDFHAFLDPTVNFPRALALSAVLVSITALIAMTHWREKFGLIYEWWRASHGLLALFLVFVGTVHIMQVSHYITEVWQQTVWIGLSLVAMGMLIHNRVWRPLQMKKRPYKVVGVEEEVDTIWNLELEPVGHEGLQFRPGQFVWLTLGDTPFSLQQHPFTISSAPHEKNIRLTIKELGDFTSDVGKVEIGTTAFLEGPYGNFTIDQSSSAHNVFVIGGIGITPAISTLKYVLENKLNQQITLFFGTPSKKLTPFYDELQEYSKLENVNLIHIFEEPPEGWEGETGFIDADILKRHLPENFTEECEFYICGPPPMMDAVEPQLHEWGVPVHRLHSERFNIV